MEQDKLTAMQISARESAEKMTTAECCNLVDEFHPEWYAEWCEREGTEEELRSYLFELLKSLF